MNNFKEGDVVILKSGGVHMTVQKAHEDGICLCVWFSDGTLNKEEFPSILLTEPGTISWSSNPKRNNHF